MIEKKVTTKNKYGEILVGIESTPDELKDKYPTVILVHGFADNKHEHGMFDELTNVLCQSGFLVYRFDFSGCGESQGDYAITSLTKLREDLHSIFDFVKQKSSVDENRIGIHAQSFGTSVTIAAQLPIKSIVLTGSFTDIQRVFKRHFGNGYDPQGISKRHSESQKQYVSIEPQFWIDIKSYKLQELVKKIHCPILFIQGEKDETCPVAEMEMLFEAANEPKGKVILEGVGHGLEPKREEMYKIAANWFMKTL